MKKKVLNVILTIFLYLALGAAILILLSVLFLLDGFSYVGQFHFGILTKTFLIIWGIGLIVPICFYKKIKQAWMLPIWMMIAIIVTTTINYGLLHWVGNYISVYTKEKWDNEEYIRYCMLDSLNEQYEFIGMTEQELTETLGQPTMTRENNNHITYQYVVGDDYTDPRFYNFTLHNGIVIDTSYSLR